MNKFEMSDPGNELPSLLSALAMSAGAAVIAEAATLPFDTAKAGNFFSYL